MKDRGGVGEVMVNHYSPPPSLSVLGVNHSPASLLCFGVNRVFVYEGNQDVHVEYINGLL